LFFHFHYLNIGIALFLLIRFSVIAKRLTLLISQAP
jgi:hypothetical protein